MGHSLTVLRALEPICGLRELDLSAPQLISGLREPYQARALSRL